MLGVQAHGGVRTRVHHGQQWGQSGVGGHPHSGDQGPHRHPTAPQLPLCCTSLVCYIQATCTNKCAAASVVADWSSLESTSCSIPLGFHLRTCDHMFHATWGQQVATARCVMAVAAEEWWTSHGSAGG